MEEKQIAIMDKGEPNIDFEKWNEALHTKSHPT